MYTACGVRSGLCLTGRPGVTCCVRAPPQAVPLQSRPTKPAQRSPRPSYEGSARSPPRIAPACPPRPAPNTRPKSAQPRQRAPLYAQSAVTCCACLQGEDCFRTEGTLLAGTYTLLSGMMLQWLSLIVVVAAATFDDAPAASKAGMGYSEFGASPPGVLGGDDALEKLLAEARAELSGVEGDERGRRHTSHVIQSPAG